MTENRKSPRTLDMNEGRSTAAFHKANKSKHSSNYFQYLPRNSTRTTPWTGIRGGRRRSSGPRSWTGPSSSPPG